MDKSDCVFVAGHRGLVGSAVVRHLRKEGFTNLLLADRAALDLTDQAAVASFFSRHKPAYVFMCAAKVGGIHANSTFPADFIRENLQLQTNIIHSAWANGATKLLFLGSSCIYPRECPQPMKESHLLSGPLEPTNEPYAIAKIAGLKMCQAYRNQYGFDAISAMPTNLYGPGDNYHPENSHVVAALIRRIEAARTQGLASVTIWGTGQPLREFLFVDDLAEALVFLMQGYSSTTPINIGSGQELSIAELARQVADALGYQGRIEFDPSRPDGVKRKRLDTSQMDGLGWRARTPLEKGLASAIADFRRSN
ncbi:MAG TPA: GDP-L-fucose synthase [Arenimonas sp.]|uniref:GDP-L-fucose synthase family protein n=1 Tax=Arenimonas sp. TaxID=1872635 RepID=UPI002D7F92E1|nr:GDP-L-fucose synthase [Arenimonas sp.]HEU0153897.1 GDP-L-fucose synthase [Arenimonas sp.]